MSRWAFIVGAQRSSTTYLYHVLSKSSHICMATPLQPEPKFFLKDDLYERGLDYYLKTYYQHPDADLLVEKSTSYMESIVSARRIHQNFPAAKIIFILRNPIERVISHYKFSCFHGLEPLSLEKALEKEEERINRYDHQAVSVSPFAYRQRGKYAEYIESYLTIFPREQTKILVQEHFINNSDAIADLCTFLETPFSEAMVLDEKFNASDDIDYDLSPEMEAALYAFYAPHNKILSKLIEDLDLSHWQK